MKFLILSVVMLFSSSIYASEVFAPMGQIVKKHVNEKSLSEGGLETSFDYVAAKKDQGTQTLIKQQSESLKKFDIKQLTSKEKAVAFWINAYNFFMLKKIIDDGFKGESLKIKGVKSFGSLFSPYKVFSLKEFNIGGVKYSLDQMEKEILLGSIYKSKKWKDARVHFAVNCASVGCPPLRNKIYSEGNLDKLLDENVKRALKTPRHFQFKGKVLSLTHLFKWYKKDFEEQEGSVKKFLKKYLEKESQTKVDASKDIEYIEYDWKLNKPSNF